MKQSNYLTYNGYEIIKMSLEAEKSNEPNKNLNILYKVQPKDSNLTDITVFQGILIDSNKEFPYKLEVLIKGDFTLLESMTLKEKKNMILTNIPAIQYPYIRALTGVLSGQTDYQRILLPTMNFHEFLKEKNWEEILITK